MNRPRRLQLGITDTLSVFIFRFLLAAMADGNGVVRPLH